MDYHVKEAEQQAIVYLQGELDMLVGERLGSLIREVGQRNQTILLDFREVTFVDSSGIGSMFFATKDLLNTGKRVEIVNIREEVLDILRVLGFTEALRIQVTPLES
ncbi:STAS domain-containing protein [Brevibacillus humidisoli]|uniref:STAS domain-containing protein n=1 Tax=Brevibacillus humidisoli TaxID=2895522 RepID=UPI001E3D8A42|nr:STAS domain-containing protein [Brevibacillus humidisoli]UFJ39063.1 STAS domain-containing protein [Brevibacillus humidisoli]